MQKKWSKRKKIKQALKSVGRKARAVGQKVRAVGQKVRGVAQSRVVKRFIPLFGLIVIFTPRGPAQAITIEVVEGLGSFGKNGAFFTLGFEGTRRVVRHGVAAIPDPNARAAVSTVGSIAAMSAGVACAVGMGICSGMGWTQKAVICAQGVGVCSGATTGLHEGDPANPATVPGKVAGEAASAAFGQFSA